MGGRGGRYDFFEVDFGLFWLSVIVSLVDQEIFTVPEDGPALGTFYN